MSTSQEPASQSPAQPVRMPGALQKRRDHRMRRLLSALELAHRSEGTFLHLQVADEQMQHIGGVLRPAWHPQVEFTDSLMTILLKEARQALLQRSG